VLQTLERVLQSVSVLLNVLANFILLTHKLQLRVLVHYEDQLTVFAVELNLLAAYGYQIRAFQIADSQG